MEDEGSIKKVISDNAKVINDNAAEVADLKVRIGAKVGENDSVFVGLQGTWSTASGDCNIEEAVC